MRFGVFAWTTFATALAVCLPTAALQAQAITVQQPQIQQFSVGTTVSVPDRGSAHLGSVSRAGSGYRNAGPFRSGTSFGQFHDHSSVRVHAWIHDLQEMDEYLLNEAGNGGAGGRRLTGPAAHAYRSLQARHGGNSDRRFSPSPPAEQARRGVAVHPLQAEADLRRLRQFEQRQEAAQGTRHRNSESSADARAEKYLRLGLDAEERGSETVARLYFEMAAKYGSPEAEAKLASADSPTDPPRRADVQENRTGRISR